MKRSIFLFIWSLTHFSSYGDCIEIRENSQIQANNYVCDNELIEVLPALKKVAKEDFAERFKHASKKLIELVSKESNRVSDIIDIDLLNDELQLHSDIIVGNCPEQLNGKPLTEITLNILDQDTKDIKTIQNFVFWSSGLRQNLWYGPHHYNKITPTLNFIPDQTLLYRNMEKIELNEHLLAVIMAGIEFDLRSAPKLRGDKVTENTRLIFDFLTRCKNNNDNPLQKIRAYQKYLNTEQNNTLTLQLLSVYLNNPNVYNCHNYMILLCQILFMNIDCNNLIPLIDDKNCTLIPLLQKYLYKEISIENAEKDKVDNFVCEAMNTKYIVNKEEEIFQKVCLERINSCFHKPIVDIYKKLNEIVCKDKNISSTFSAKFVTTMCIGPNGILPTVLDYLDYNKILDLYKTMHITKI